MQLKNNFIQKQLLLLFAFTTLSITSCSGDSDSVVAPPPVNYKPTAADDTLTVNENSVAGVSNQVTVSTNDNIGKDGGDTDNYSLKANATNGNATEISDGVFQYIPKADYFGTDSFTYTLTDKNGDSVTAKVTVTVVEIVEGPSAEVFKNINPDFPSFVSIADTTPEDKKWEKQTNMSDEFDTWNSSKWFKSTWNYGVPVFMTTAGTNSGVSDGKLWIKATLNESNADGRWFQTARIHSRTKINYPMYTEARIKSAHISAYNTYWLNNGDSNNRDEIDIIENNSKPSCGCQPNYPLQMNSQYFHADSSKSPIEIRDEDNFLNTKLSKNNPANGVKWNEEYQTFGVWWKDERHIQFYLNGEPAGSVEVGHDRSGKSYTDRFFTRDLEIIFDLWTNEATWLGGLPPKSDLGDETINTMRIDWVRTWKLVNK
jgi:hypothetical protein